MSFYSNPNYYKGDMFYVKNSKYYGTNYGNGGERPAIILSVDEFNNDPNNPFVVVAYLTTKSKYEYGNVGTHVRVLCNLPSVVLLESITKVPKDNIAGFIRKATDAEMAEVDKAITNLFGVEAVVETKEIEAHVSAEAETENNIYKKLYYELLDRVLGGEANGRV